MAHYLDTLKHVRPLSDFAVEVDSPRKQAPKVNRARYQEEESYEDVYPTQTTTQTATRYFRVRGSRVLLITTANLVSVNPNATFAKRPRPLKSFLLKMMVLLVVRLTNKKILRANFETGMRLTTLPDSS